MVYKRFFVKGGYRKLQSNVKDCQDFSTKAFHQSLGDHNRAAHKKREEEDMDDKTIEEVGRML